MRHTATKIRLGILALALAGITYKIGYAEGLHFLHSIVAFIVILSIIVFIHEFGHYIVAKWAGVKIETFSLGFGNELWGWNDKSGTRWKISSLPFGGYVKMFGDATEASTPVDEINSFTPEDREKAFYFKPLYKKAAIVIAGPLFNFLLTVIILTGFIFTQGLQSAEPVAGEVMKGMPAASAGIEPGDRILAINGDKVSFFNDIPRMLMTNLGTPVTFEIQRAEKVFPVTITPKMMTENEFTHPAIGIKSKLMQVQSLGPVQSLKEAVRATYNLCDMTLRVIGQIIMGERSAKDTIKGPIGMAKLTGQAAEQGILSSLSIMALISANLGLVNLFPIPVLDGGHLLFYAIEAIIGRPPGKRFQEYGMRLGMALVAMLMAFAVVNDIHVWLLSLAGK